MRFYVASGLPNFENARKLGERLKMLGHVQTYDWTVHGAVYDRFALEEQNVRTMSDCAHREQLGVESADLVIVLLPGGRGTHVEMGMALSCRKSVHLIGHDAPLSGEADVGKHVAFYWHRLVSHHPTIDSFMNHIAVLSTDEEHEQLAGDLSCRPPWQDV